MKQKDSRIFVAGHNGMVGSAVLRNLQKLGYENILLSSRKSLNLTSQSEVNSYFHNQDIDVVILAAAKVGGIHANNEFPAEFIYENLMIETNIINASHQYGVDKLIFLGSSCIYPRDSSQPISEKELLNGKLEPTNEPYAVAKIAGIKLCESFNRQYGRNYISLMPTNLFGPGDNFHPEFSHVLPSLIRKFHEAVSKQEDSVVVWGSGNPKREFLHVDDLASAVSFMLELPKSALERFTSPMDSHINIGTGKDISIRELADLISQVTGFQGDIIFDQSMPDGTPRKLLDVSKINEMGWSNSISLSDGIKSTYAWYLENISNLRN